MAWLYVVILLLLAAGLWGAYRVLGTPSRLAPRDYNVVLADVATSVERAAGNLRRALEAGPGRTLEDQATSARKIFQTGYYQTLRLRPSSGPDAAGPAPARVGPACEGDEWARPTLPTPRGPHPPAA